MRAAAYVVAPFLSFPNTITALLTAPPDFTICSMPRPDGLSILRPSIHLIDSLHLRTRQSPAKKASRILTPVPVLSIRHYFCRPRGETAPLSNVLADFVAGHLPLPRHLGVFPDMERFDKPTCLQICLRVGSYLPFGGFIASHSD